MSSGTLPPYSGGGYILELCRGHWAANTLFCAVKLGIFDLLEEGAVDAGRAAAALGTHPEATARLLAALESLGLVEREEDSRYRNSPLAARHLVRGKDGYLGHTVRHFASLAGGWSRLEEAVRTGRPVGLEMAAQEDYLRRLRVYVLAMADQARLKADRLAGALDLGGCRDFLDLGGGPGVYTVALLKKNPSLRATILDLAPTLEITRGLLAAAGMEGKVKLREGDFTRDDFGEGAYDLVLVSNVLHIYDEKTGRLVLEKIFRALRPGGRVVVHDYFQNGGPVPEAALFDLNMLLGTLCGRVYGVREIKCWLEETGFQKISFLPLDRGSGLLTGRKNAFPVQKTGVEGGRAIEFEFNSENMPSINELTDYLSRKARERGAEAVRVCAPQKVVVASWVRWKCQYGCPFYGKSLTCPPFSPLPEETEKVLQSYRRGIIFLAGESWLVRHLAVCLERLAFSAGYYRAFGLGAGPCVLCAGECDTGGHCRRPEEARPSMEACGIDVFQTLRNAGLDLFPARGPKEPCPRVGLLLLE